MSIGTTEMDLEEARRLQDEWFAAQPKWPPREESPVERFVNGSFAVLPQESQRAILRNNLELTPTERIERNFRRCEQLLAAHESEWQAIMERSWDLA